MLKNIKTLVIVLIFLIVECISYAQLENKKYDLVQRGGCAVQGNIPQRLIYYCLQLGRDFSEFVGISKNQENCMKAPRPNNNDTAANNALVGPLLFDNCPCVGATGATGMSGILGYAHIANATFQTVLGGANINFSNNGIITPGILHTPGQAGISFTASGAGTYAVLFTISVLQRNQIALTLDNVNIPLTVFGSASDGQQNTGMALVTVSAGQTLRLKNNTAVTMFLSNPIVGTAATTNAVIILVQLAPL